MIPIPSGLRVWIATGHTDMRRGMNGQPLRAEMLRAALDTVALHHGVRLHDLVLVRAGSSPKTSSGKVRRDRCREFYMQGALNPIFRLSNRT